MALTASSDLYTEIIYIQLVISIDHISAWFCGRQEAFKAASIISHLGHFNI